MNPDIQALLRYGDKPPSPTFWCKKCNVPLIQEKCERCGKEGIILSKNPLRPVFKEELDIIRKQTRSKSRWLSLTDLSFWAAKRNYFYNGQKVYSSGLNNGNPYEIKFSQNREVALPKKPLRPETVIKRLKMANLTSLNRLEYQALVFIEQAVKTFHGKLPIVSFSGGKDSCVVSHLARLALGSRIIHIFGDTTIEYPDTYNFIDDFKKNNPTIPFLTTRPSKDFFELVEEIGPPSRILRWCCTTHKTGPLSLLINSIEGNGTLGFVGNRKAESARRSKYHCIEFKHKFVNEIVANPILSWSDTELWLYILTRGIQISKGYRKGLLRAGCLYCPFNTGWSEFIANTIYRKDQTKWKRLLMRYATKVNHKKPEEFLNEGWKVRAGADGSKPLRYQKTQCDTDEDAYNYKLVKNWDDSFWEYIKPLGRLVKLYDDGIIANYFLNNSKTKETMIAFKVSKYRNHVRATIIQQKGRLLLMQRLDKQISRFQVCVLCGRCHEQCRHRAISSLQTYKFKIDENKCVNCLECVKTPCSALEALKIRGKTNWDFSQEHLV
jgi:phosphoadenosine phosphosulfate reductase